MPPAPGLAQTDRVVKLVGSNCQTVGIVVGTLPQIRVLEVVGDGSGPLS